jgi:hypothetical protein
LACRWCRFVTVSAGVALQLLLLLLMKRSARRRCVRQIIAAANSAYSIPWPDQFVELMNFFKLFLVVRCGVCVLFVGSVV